MRPDEIQSTRARPAVGARSKRWRWRYAAVAKSWMASGASTSWSTSGNGRPHVQSPPGIARSRAGTNTAWFHSDQERDFGTVAWFKANSGGLTHPVGQLKVNPFGLFVERADNTARLLDVKYHVLLPEKEIVGGSLDYFQWSAILRSVSALTAYHWVYREAVKPLLIADLLILNRRMPRSLAACYENISRFLDLLGGHRQLRPDCGEVHRHVRTRLPAEHHVDAVRRESRRRSSTNW